MMSAASSTDRLPAPVPIGGTVRLANSHSCAWCSVARQARLCRDEIRSIEIKKDIQDGFNARIQRRMQNTPWAKGCTSWYLTAAGKNTANWPGYSFVFRLKTRAPKWDDYAVQ